MTQIKKLSVWLLPISAVFLFLYQLGSIPLWSGDEGRFGEIAREMVELREYLIPQFFYLNFLEKPILYPLSTALSCLLLGVNSLAVRLPGAVAGLAGILMTWRFCRAVYGERSATRAVVVLTTFVGYLMAGRLAIIDMVLTFFISAAILCFATAYIEKRPRRYLAAYALMGAAFLTKGLIGILMPALVFGGFLIWNRGLGEIRNMKIGWGLLILAIMILPYGIAVSMRQPEFFHVFIMEQHFSRYSTGSFGRHKPFWFFLPVYLATGLPWSFYAPTAAVACARAKDKPGLYSRLMVIWIAAVLIFFSLPKSKLPYYILSSAIPTAVLIGAWFAGRSRSGLEGEIKVWRGLMWLGWPVLFAGAIYATFYIADPRVAALVPLIWPALGVVCVSGVLANRFMKQGNVDRVFWTLAAATYLFLLITIGGMKILTPYFSTSEFARTIARHLSPQDVVAVYSSADRFSDLPFHLKRRVMVVGSDRGTITEESKGEEHSEDSKKWFMETGAFAELFNQRDRIVYCLMDRDGLVELEQVGMRGWTIVKEMPGKLLVCNHEFPAPNGVV